MDGSPQASDSATARLQYNLGLCGGSSIIILRLGPLSFTISGWVVIPRMYPARACRLEQIAAEVRASSWSLGECWPDSEHPRPERHRVRGPWGTASSTGHGLQPAACIPSSPLHSAAGTSVFP